MSLLDGETGPITTVTIPEGVQSKAAWEAAGASGADELFKYSHARTHVDPGTLVYLKFDHLDITEELRLAAIAAFNARWAELVPGWTPPVKDDKPMVQQ